MESRNTRAKVKPATRCNKGVGGFFFGRESEEGAYFVRIIFSFIQSGAKLISRLLASEM